MHHFRNEIIPVCKLTFGETVAFYEPSFVLLLITKEGEKSRIFLFFLVSESMLSFGLFGE